MEEKLDRIEKNINDLIEIVGAIKDNMVTKDELAQRLDGVREELGSKIEGVQRSVDGVYERHSALEARVTKIETELHL